MTAAALDELATAAVAHLNRLFEATETRAWPQFGELPADLGPGFERLQRELGASRPAPAVVPPALAADALLPARRHRRDVRPVLAPGAGQRHRAAVRAAVRHRARVGAPGRLRPRGGSQLRGVADLPRGRRAHAVQRVAVSGGAASGAGPGIVAGGPRHRARSRPPRRLRGGSRADQPGDAHRPAGRPGGSTTSICGPTGWPAASAATARSCNWRWAPISGAGGGRRPRSGGGRGRSDAGSPVRARQRGRLVLVEAARVSGRGAVPLRSRPRGRLVLVEAARSPCRHPDAPPRRSAGPAGPGRSGAGTAAGPSPSRIRPAPASSRHAGVAGGVRPVVPPSRIRPPGVVPAVRRAHGDRVQITRQYDGRPGVVPAVRCARLVRPAPALPGATRGFHGGRLSRPPGVRGRV